MYKLAIAIVCEQMECH